MKNLCFLAFLLFTFNISAQDYALVIHGGAGNIDSTRIGPELQKQYQEKLEEALLKGEEVLKSEGSALDAVVAVIQILEESPLFNAGKGAVFTWEGSNELDASIMDGSNLNAGAMTRVSQVKSPIAGAREVMENSPHVMLSGKGAEQFARSRGLEMVDSNYFETEKRRKSLERYKRKQGYLSDTVDWKYGTVGCVALDSKGNIAAGTSTGGMTGKRYGRIGDSPIIGAGTYANNESCGVSSTGHGEYFIRYNVAYDISALMTYKNYSLQKAANEVIQKKLLSAGGRGGIIALDRNANITMEFNTTGMFRAFLKQGETPQVFMFK